MVTLPYMERQHLKKCNMVLDNDCVPCQPLSTSFATAGCCRNTRRRSCRMSGRDQTKVVTRVLDFLKDHFKISLFLIFNSILPLSDDVTDSFISYDLFVSGHAFENVLKEEDKKTELELTKPAFLWNDEDKKRQEREERRIEAAEKVLLELAKVRLTEEAGLSKQFSELKKLFGWEGNKQLREALKKNKSIPQNIKNALGV